MTPLMSVKNTHNSFFSVLFPLVLAHLFHSNIFISVDFWGVEAALLKILELYDQNPWRNDLSKWPLLTLFYSGPNSALDALKCTLLRPLKCIIKR